MNKKILYAGSILAVVVALVFATYFLIQELDSVAVNGAETETENLTDIEISTPSDGVFYLGQRIRLKDPEHYYFHGHESAYYSESSTVLLIGHYRGGYAGGANLKIAVQKGGSFMLDGETQTLVDFGPDWIQLTKK